MAGLRGEQEEDLPSSSHASGGVREGLHPDGRQGAGSRQTSPRRLAQEESGTASLESYLKQGPAKPVIFQNIALQRIQITIIKSELLRLLRVYNSCSPEMKTDFLKEIRKISPSAVSLFEETHGPELHELIRQVESLAKAEADR